MNWERILQEAKTDTLLAGLVNEVQEYAQIYLLAKERQKGCNGMAQLVSLKEEFKDVIDRLLQYYCRKNDRPMDMKEHDIDSISTAFSKSPSTA